ncbi:MAG TPA: TMEM175 family protein [Candidatus Dormibacteraeota bacterium]
MSASTTTHEPHTPRAEGREAQRLEAFSDGVLAVIITIMAFSLAVPSNTTWSAISQQIPPLLVYVLSFTLIGIYWNNHHHLLKATQHISSGVMWANLHLLFWLSLTPVATKWVGLDSSASVPAAVYGIVSLGAGGAYSVLVRMIIRANGRDSRVARAVGSNTKGRLSLSGFATGIGLSWISPWIAYALYAAVAVMWLVPNRLLLAADGAD